MDLIKNLLDFLFASVVVALGFGFLKLLGILAAYIYFN